MLQSRIFAAKIKVLITIPGEGFIAFRHVVEVVYFVMKERGTLLDVEKLQTTGVFETLVTPCRSSST